MRARRFLRASIVLVALALGLVVGQAQYRSSGVITLLSLTGTNTFTAATTNSYALDLDVGQSAAACLHVQFAGVGADAETVVLVLVRGLDQSTYETTETHRIGVAANGTNTVVLLTNLTVSAERFLRLTKVENPNTNALTNVVIKWSFKR